MNITATWPNITVLAANGTRITSTVGILWRHDRPFDIRVMIGNGGRLHAPACWTIDRESLTNGLHHPVGVDRGDYLILPDLTAPDGHRIELILAPYGRGVGRSVAVVLPVADVRDFLDGTYEVIPMGAEVDASINELTEGAA